MHGVRALLSTRKALLSKTIDLANEVRGLLKIFGLRLPKSVQNGSFDKLVRPMIEIDEVLAHALIPLLDARLVLYQHFLELDRRVKRAAARDEVCLRMMTVPGVGPIAALTFKAAVDDPTRFKKSRTVAAHFGLTPRRFQSGEKDNPGHISKAGDRDVRATLYAAAFTRCQIRLCLARATRSASRSRWIPGSASAERLPPVAYCSRDP